MDINQFRRHLRNLNESQAANDAARLARALDDFDRAAKNLIDAWEPLIDSSDHADDVTSPDHYPFADAFDELVPRISKFVANFKTKLRSIK